MALPYTALAKALARRAALDDLMVALMVARCALRVLRLATQDPTEKAVVDALAGAMAEGQERFRWL